MVDTGNMSAGNAHNGNRQGRRAALLNPETSIFLQKRPSYGGNLNLETPGDRKNAFYTGEMF